MSFRLPSYTVFAGPNAYRLVADLAEVHCCFDSDDFRRHHRHWQLPAAGDATLDIVVIEE
ncbi:hypothetical protein BS627_04815 [Agrobacterium salinitolerans]|uniref:hypothetical protein n=1 Tax=Agrobacterium salinitolerans TaxID=1183413 RepID=UPI00098FDE31|nr:hypothetical protein [Agrobacterium salinitolerans]OOO26374.1 hypothetical protein BS627_04815 [Agrobacterium salinitolerans]PNQ24555.1 hypothetical protein C2E26_04895 [Rhizobium sp. YIC5082]